MAPKTVESENDGSSAKTAPEVRNTIKVTHPPGVKTSESIFNKLDGSLKGTFNFLILSEKKFKVSLPLLYTTLNSSKKDFPN